MTDRTPSTFDPHADLNAFVRGIERRAAVFAELLCGDAIAGDAALAAAIRAFRGMSVGVPMPAWPWRFWGLLLATPQLRRSSALQTRSGPLSALSAMPNGLRAAVLLRLAGGLTEADAASALGLAIGTYRMALHRALPHRADGSADADAWRAMAEALQAMVKSLPAPRLAQLARIREAALHGQGLASSPAPTPTAGSALGRPRWQRPALYALAASTFAALAVTFIASQPAIEAAGAPRIRRVALPPAESPASTFDARTALLSHRDLDLLIDAQDEAMSRDLDFHAWLAAESVTRAAAGFSHADGSAAGSVNANDAGAGTPWPAQPVVAPPPDRDGR